MLSALLIGKNRNILLPLPQLLNRSGFIVDVITSSSEIQYSKFIHQYTFVPFGKSLVSSIRKILEKNYDWIIVTEEEILQEIIDSSLSSQEKLRILPVISEKSFPHLNSKAHLSDTFKNHGIKTPPFYISKHIHEALLSAKLLGYPILLKKDSSSGGNGIFECQTSSDFNNIPHLFFDQKIVVQKKIYGEILDLSALFFEGRLIHFNYARQDKVSSNKFGPSHLRTYKPLSFVEESFFHELSNIGKALGLNGFSNISCVRQSNKECFYFEADARPNAWLDFPRYLGEDLSLRIRDWFSERKVLSFPVPPLPNQPKQLVIPYFLRLKAWEIFFNRYRVWKYIPMDDSKLILRLLFQILCIHPIKNLIVKRLKKILPFKSFKRLKETYVRRRNLNFKRPYSDLK